MPFSYETKFLIIVTVPRWKCPWGAQAGTYRILGQLSSYVVFELSHAVTFCNHAGYGIVVTRNKQ